MATRRRRRQLWMAKISRVDRDPSQLALVHDHFEDELRRALDPDRQADYYGRVWRLSQPQIDGPYFSGKLGFARGARAEEVHYDESVHDWIEEEAPSRQGNFSHYVIHIPSQIVAFEEKGDELSRRSFLNALGRFPRDRGLRGCSDVRYQFIRCMAGGSGSSDPLLRHAQATQPGLVSTSGSSPGDSG